MFDSLMPRPHFRFYESEIVADSKIAIMRWPSLLSRLQSATIDDAFLPIQNDGSCMPTIRSGLWTLRDSTTSWLDTSRLLPIFGFGYFETHVWTPRDYCFWILRDCFSLEVTKIKILRNSNILLLFNLIEIFFGQAFLSIVTYCVFHEIILFYPKHFKLTGITYRHWFVYKFMVRPWVALIDFIVFYLSYFLSFWKKTNEKQFIVLTFANSLAWPLLQCILWPDHYYSVFLVYFYV